MTSRVAVVGAGISGLAAAWRLHRLGHDVVVLEAADHVGGKLAGPDVIDGYRLNRGAGVYAGTYEALFNLARELDREQDIVHPPAIIGLMRYRRVHWLRGEGFGAIADFVRTPLISARSKLLLRRLAADAFRARRKIGYGDIATRGEFDTESVAEYCDRRLNAELRDHLIAPLLGGVWVMEGGGMSATDLFFLLAKFMGKGLRGYRGRIDFVAQAIAERIPTRLGAEVQRVEPYGSGARVTWTEGGEHHEECVDGVVLSLAAPLVPPIYPDLEPDIQAILLEGLQQATYIALRVALDRRPDVDGLFVAMGGESEVIGSLAFEHNISPDVAPPGKGLLAVFLFSEWAEPRMHLTDDELVDAILPDLDLVIPGVADMITFIRVTRWSPAVTRSVPGVHGVMAELDAKLDDGRRIQHAGDYLSYGSIEGSVVSGETAARRLHASINHTKRA